MTAIRVARPDSLPPATRSVRRRRGVGRHRQDVLPRAPRRRSDPRAAPSSARSCSSRSPTRRSPSCGCASATCSIGCRARRRRRADGEPCWEIDDAARRRLRAAVTAFDHAPIFTIHGFCHRILIEDAFAARRLFEQTQIADEVAFDAAFGALLRERFARVRAGSRPARRVPRDRRTVDKLRELLLGARAPTRRVPPAARSRRRARGRRDALHAALGTRDAARSAARAAARRQRPQRWVPAGSTRSARALDRVDPRRAGAAAARVIDELRERADEAARAAAIARQSCRDLVAALRGAVELHARSTRRSPRELLPPILDADRRRQGRARPVRLRRHARARVATRCAARAATSSPRGCARARRGR